MARIYKRNDVWYLDVRVKGKRLRKRVGKSKRIAELALKDAEVKIAKDEFGFSKNDVSIDNLIERFLEYNRTNHRESTTKRYKAVTDHFRRYLAEKRPELVALSQITNEVIEGYKAFRRDEWVNPNGRLVKSEDDITAHTRKGARARTVNLELEGLKTMFNLAIRWEYLRENPVKQVKLLKTDDKKSVRFLTVGECERLLESSPRILYPVFYTFLNTGMRKSELENLQWQDIDFKRRRILIRPKSDWKPKTRDREIPMSDDLHEELTKLKARSLHTGEDDYAFPAKGEGHSHNWLRSELIKIAKSAGIDDLTKVHTLRHTFASHLVMQSVDLPTVGKLMGHSDIETTMIYAHLAPDHLAKAVTKLPFKRR